MAVSNIPLPPTLDIKNGNIMNNLNLFKKAWAHYEVATGLDSQPHNKRISNLMLTIGNDAFKFYERLTLNQTQKLTTGNILKALEDHLKPKINVTYERYVFHSRRQQANEPFADFLAKLRRLVVTCSFGSYDNEFLKDGIVSY
ncbi:hypothetical protein ILUMI_06964 [Ignelater luminosus]|uniref:Uncharacterized protein n=1 Tax=Ignelater luminosus TaxID=2038154 RepID=A0A8K0DA55_IGNLU|nr:hypothetical protein ILUMI_06964 [Ignelater luminosus]